DEAKEVVAKDKVSPSKKKQRMLKKGVAAATSSEAEAAEKDATTTMATKPVVAAQDKVEAEKQVRKTKA
ncbi:hypothetical protein Dimus_003682, partial [Dionaea muscipula]